MKKGFWMVFFCLSISNPMFAADRGLVKSPSLILEVGNWQPHSLNDDPQFTTFGAAGATPYWGLGFYTPLFGELGCHLSMGYWSLKDLDEVETVHALVLHPILLNLKYWLVPDSKLAAYVVYGGGIYWGIENESDPFGDRLYKARSGWGINLGAGFDLAIWSKCGIGLTFQYHFVR